MVGVDRIVIKDSCTSSLRPTGSSQKVMAWLFFDAVKVPTVSGKNERRAIRPFWSTADEENFELALQSLCR